MSKERTLACYTCGADQPHRQPRDEREREIIRKLTKKRYVEDYWICATTERDCRNIRYWWSIKPFDPPEKMPEPE
jgi:hypothetical protein